MSETYKQLDESQLKQVTGGIGVEGESTPAHPQCPVCDMLLPAGSGGVSPDGIHVQVMCDNPDCVVKYYEFVISTGLSSGNAWDKNGILLNIARERRQRERR